MPDTSPLVGWKQIADYLKLSRRTARRWGKFGLPVHRVGTGNRPVTYRSELDAWLQNLAVPPRKLGQMRPKVDKGGQTGV
jgi:hypothetical protein